MRYKYTIITNHIWHYIKLCRTQCIRLMNNYIFSKFNIGIYNINSQFPSYAGWTEGDYNIKSNFTINSINNVFPLLVSIANHNTNCIEVEHVDCVVRNNEDAANIEKLGNFLLKYSSDKVKMHDYHKVYGALYEKPEKVSFVLEIGILNGSSLRAFKDYFSNAKIYGADIREDRLFSEERIDTFIVNQLNPTSLKDLANSLDKEFDLIIDDGLHTISANLNVLIAFISRIKIGGHLVIEDICPTAIDVWRIVSCLLGRNYNSKIYRGSRGCMFVIKRIL